jgi:hypothetical protein
MNDPEKATVTSPLPREEYVEQIHFFSTLAQRLKQNMPAQEILEGIREEILVTTKLPMAIDFLLAELRHLGGIATAMRRLSHYFTPFQQFVIGEAENDRKRFDLFVALEILTREARYRTEDLTEQGLFLYQLESLCRNRLGYDEGLQAVADDPSFNQDWRNWILTVRRQIGIVDLSDLIYVRSEYYHQQREKNSQHQITQQQSIQQAVEHGAPPLFGPREGRIAWANRGKDLLLLFAALNRQLGYPQAPRPAPADPEQHLLPSLARRVEQLEARLKLVEEEQRGGIQLDRFYEPPGK